MDRKIKAVVFDMDDTLYPERDYIRSGYQAVSLYLASDDHPAQEIFALLWEIFSHDPREKVFDQVLARLGIVPSSELIQTLISIYREHIPAINPLPGIERLLAQLRRAGYKLGLISDGYLPGQQYKLQALGLADKFDRVIFTESLGRENWKPAPLAFKIMADELESEPENCLYIGDNLKKDFVAPNQLGWQSICLKADFQIHYNCQAVTGGEPMYYVTDINELIKLLSQQD